MKGREGRVFVKEGVKELKYMEVTIRQRGSDRGSDGTKE